MTSPGHRVRPTSVRPGAATLDDLKGRILAAQKARILINDPAVYRLDFIVRLLASLTILGDLVDLAHVFQTSDIGRDQHIQRSGGAFTAWVTLVCIRQALGLFLVCVFWRLIRQIQRNQARELTSSILVLARVYVAIIAGNIVALPFWLARTQSRTEAVRAVWSTLIGVTVLSGLIVVIRRHARNAAPAIAARLDETPSSPPANRYMPLRYLFLVCAAAAILLTTFGYLRAGPSA